MGLKNHNSEATTTNYRGMSFREIKLSIEAGEVSEKVVVSVYLATGDDSILEALDFSTACALTSRLPFKPKRILKSLISDKSAAFSADYLIEEVMWYSFATQDIKDEIVDFVLAEQYYPINILADIKKYSLDYILNSIETEVTCSYLKDLLFKKATEESEIHNILNHRYINLSLSEIKDREIPVKTIIAYFLNSKFVVSDLNKLEISSWMKKQGDEVSLLFANKLSQKK